MKHLYALLSGIILAFPIYAQEVDTTLIDEIYAAWDNENGPGGVVGIYQDGELIFAKGYGLANMSDHVPNSTKTKFYLASTSKQFTAACIIHLIQQGKLSFDSKLSEFFPEFPRYADKITIKNMLNHTSGLRDYVGLLWHKFHIENWLDSYSDEEVMRLVSRQKTTKIEVGQKWDYSNTNYFLLAKIVEKVTEMPFSEYVKKIIFDPLSMDNTLVYNSIDLILEYSAIPYSMNPEGEYQMLETAHTQTGATGVYSTLEDMKKWDDEFYNRELFDDEFWQLMTERCVLNSGDTIQYAAGLEVEPYRGLNTIHHAGALVGFRSHMVRFPDQHLTIIAFGNYAQSNPIDKVYATADILLKDQLAPIPEKEALKEDKPKKIKPEELDKFTGSYWAQRRNGIINLIVQNDTLKFNLVSNQFWPLIYIGNNKFQMSALDHNDQIAFNVNHKDSSVFIWYREYDGEFKKIMHGKRIEIIELSDQLIDDYTGDYYNDELEVFYRFLPSDDGISLFANGKKSNVINYVTKDQFSENNSSYIFERNESGDVIGFTIYTIDNYNLYFDKIEVKLRK